MLELLGTLNRLPVFETNDLSKLINTTGWSRTDEEGWFKNDRNWGQRIDIVIPDIDIRRIRKIQVTVTGYYNIPANCLGWSILGCQIGSSFIEMGTNDAWDLPSTGQDIARGDLPRLSKVTRDAVGEIFQITVPDGSTLSKLYIGSAGYSSGAINYAISKRGLKDFKFWYK